MKNKKSKRFGKFPIFILILASFLIVILLGAVLLALPISHQGEGLNFVDAFFTSTSAVCVTGLSPVSDISSRLNLFGRIVLAILIEIGGLGFVTIVTFIGIVLGFKIGLSQRLLLKEALNQDNVSGLVKMVKRIVMTAFIIQLIGFVLNFIDFYFIHHMEIDAAIGFGLFHAISSFNNAGFDLFGSSSLITFSDDILLNFSTSLLIILGGIGFIVIFDIFEKKSFRKLSLHSKVVILTTIFLLVFGTVVYKLTDLKLTWLECFFMSVSTRTAGFTVVDLSRDFSQAAVLFTIFLMFVGASPASTGGGVKTTTLFTILASIRAFATGEHQTHAFKRRISDGLIVKAFILTTFAISFIVFSSFIILAIEQENFTLEEILFEVTSGFGTVGLTLGITSELSVYSKLIICLVMYVGRLGPVTFISLFNHRSADLSTDTVGYVKGTLIIG